MAKRENTDLEKAALWMVIGYFAGPGALLLFVMAVAGLVSLFS